MLLTNHTLTGLALGASISNPIILAPLALGSHFLMDAMPHFGYKGLDISRGVGLKLAISDGLMSTAVFAAAIWLLPVPTWMLALGAFAATFPDLLYIPRYLFQYRPNNAWARFHKAIQHELPAGVITEIIWLGLMVYFLAPNL